MSAFLRPSVISANPVASLLCCFLRHCYKAGSPANTSSASAFSELRCRSSSAHLRVSDVRARALGKNHDRYFSDLPSRLGAQRLSVLNEIISSRWVLRACRSFGRDVSKPVGDGLKPAPTKTANRDYEHEIYTDGDRLIPSLSMRDRKVLGLIPRISAAPFLPWITQLVSFNARMM